MQSDYLVKAYKLRNAKNRYTKYNINTLKSNINQSYEVPNINKYNAITPIIQFLAAIERFSSKIIEDLINMLETNDKYDISQLDDDTLKLAEKYRQAKKDKNKNDMISVKSKLTVLVFNKTKDFVEGCNGIFGQKTRDRIYTNTNANNRTRSKSQSFLKTAGKAVVIAAATGYAMVPRTLDDDTKKTDIPPRSYGPPRPPQPEPQFAFSQNIAKHSSQRVGQLHQQYIEQHGTVENTTAYNFNFTTSASHEDYRPIWEHDIKFAKIMDRLDQENKNELDQKDIEFESFVIPGLPIQKYMSTILSDFVTVIKVVASPVTYPLRLAKQGNEIVSDIINQKTVNAKENLKQGIVQGAEIIINTAAKVASSVTDNVKTAAANLVNNDYVNELKKVEPEDYMVTAFRTYSKKRATRRGAYKPFNPKEFTQNSKEREEKVRKRFQEEKEQKEQKNTKSSAPPPPGPPPFPGPKPTTSPPKSSALRAMFPQLQTVYAIYDIGEAIINMVISCYHSLKNYRAIFTTLQTWTGRFAPHIVIFIIHTVKTFVTNLGINPTAEQMSGAVMQSLIQLLQYYTTGLADPLGIILLYNTHSLLSLGVSGVISTTYTNIKNRIQQPLPKLPLPSMSTVTAPISYIGSAIYSTITAPKKAVEQIEEKKPEVIIEVKPVNNITVVLPVKPSNVYVSSYSKQQAKRLRMYQIMQKR